MRNLKKKVLVSIPENLLRKLDEVAAKEKRSRSAAVCVRIERSINAMARKEIAEK